MTWPCSWLPVYWSCDLQMLLLLHFIYGPANSWLCLLTRKSSRGTYIQFWGFGSVSIFTPPLSCIQSFHFSVLTFWLRWVVSILQVSNKWWLWVSLSLLLCKIHIVLNLNNTQFSLWWQNTPFIIGKTFWLSLCIRNLGLDGPPKSLCSPNTVNHTYWHQQNVASQSICSTQPYLQITKHIQQPMVSSRSFHNYDVWHLNMKFKILSFLYTNART